MAESINGTPQKARPRMLDVMRAGIEDSGDLAELIIASMEDVVEDRISTNVAGHVTRQWNSLIRLKEIEHKFGHEHPTHNGVKRIDFNRKNKERRLASEARRQITE